MPKITDPIRVETHETLRTTAAIGERLITLDPIRTIPITLEIREVESTIPCGLQQEWGEVDVDNDRLALTAGAGFGNGYGTITFRNRRYYWAIGDIAAAFLTAVKDEA
jgi:hypothetical protein